MSISLQPLTASEEEIMQHIWEKGEMYFRDIMNTFPEPKPHQNTVSTFLKILVDKNYLTTKKIGRIYLYSPNIDYETYKTIVSKIFLDNYFGSSPISLITFLIENSLISQSDLKEISSKNTTLKNKKSDPMKDYLNEITSSDKKKSKKKKKKKGNKKGDQK